MLEVSSLTVVAAQMVPLDINYILTQGPAYILLGLAVWYIIRQEDRHDQKIAAERALNVKLQEQIMENQKVLIPLSLSMVAATEQSTELVKRALER